MTTTTDEATNRTRSLWGIATDIEQIEALADTAFDAAPPEDEAGAELRRNAEDALLDLLISKDGDLTAKIDSYCRVIRDRESRAVARKAEADRIRALAASDENTVKRMKAAMQEALDIMGREKVETLRFKVSVQANGGPLPLHIAPDIQAVDVDPRFQKVSVDFDTDAIRRALATGSPIYFAELGVRGKHVRIK